MKTISALLSVIFFCLNSSSVAQTQTTNKQLFYTFEAQAVGGGQTAEFQFSEPFVDKSVRANFRNLQGGQISDLSEDPYYLYLHKKDGFPWGRFITQAFEILELSAKNKSFTLVEFRNSEADPMRNRKPETDLPLGSPNVYALGVDSDEGISELQVLVPYKLGIVNVDEKSFNSEQAKLLYSKLTQIKGITGVYFMPTIFGFSGARIDIRKTAAIHWGPIIDSVESTLKSLYPALKRGSE